MILVRHNRLQEPYNSYESLSMAELDDIATGKVSPPIEEVISLDFVCSEIIEGLKGAEKVLCSESIRTQLTCRAIMSLLDIDIPTETDSRLNEIIFVPSKIVPEGGGENPLSLVRSSLYEHMLKGGSHADSKFEIEKRIQSLFDDCRGKSIVCFTHGFLMRLIEAYEGSGESIDIALKNISEYQPVDYLQSMSFDRP